MVNNAKVAIIGGFLGAGKTTTMIQVGRKLILEFGKRAAIITNDQGEVLVDTKIVKEFGFIVAEVLYGCFCCRFPDFIVSAHEILAETAPDVILAEPVGSCIDLPATVYTPLRQYYHNEFSLAPLIVLVDASRILSISSKNPFPPIEAIEYLASRQIQEAEVVGVNKIDLVPRHQLMHIKDLIRKLNNRAEILMFSAKTGVGLDKLLDQILHKEHNPYSYPKVDYNVYAAAEAELGWFNGSWNVKAEQEFEAKEFIKDLLIETANKIKKREGEVAHLKVYFTSDKGSTKASLVTLYEVDFTGDVQDLVQGGDVTMNARVALGPEGVTLCIREALEVVASKYSARYSDWKAKSISPPPPKPYYSPSKDNIVVSNLPVRKGC